MKILILSDDFPPQSFGGAGFSTFYLARGLQKAGHQVFVITTCREKANEGKTSYQGLEVHTIFADYHDRWRGYLSLYNPQTVGKVGRIIKEIRPDIIHANNIQSYLSYHCLKIAKKYGPVFFTARDTTSFNQGKLATEKYLARFDCRVSQWDEFKQTKKRYNPLRNFFIKRYLSYVDQIFSVSRALKDALSQNGIKNVEVSYTGTDVNNWQIAQEKVEEFKKKYGLSGKKIIFFGGRISTLKGSEQINLAIEIIKKEIPGAFLLAAGKGSIGWLSGDDLKAAYAAADVVVVPSIYFDPFPRSNLEAMACQKPVVATCYGGSPEIVQDNITGFIVNPLDEELMAKKIIDLLKNSEKAKQFGEAGYERIKKHFNLESQIAQTIHWYQEAQSRKINDKRSVDQ